MVQVWGNTLVDSFQVLWLNIAAILPNILIALVIFVAGWIVGSFVGRLIESAFRSLKVDSALRSAGVEEVTNRAGLKLNSGRFVGGLVEWFIILAFLIASFDVLHLTAVTQSLSDIALEKLPHIIAAVLILMVAVVIAEFVKKLVIASLRAAGIRSANFIGSAAKWAIWLFAASAALSQLGIASDLLLALFQGLMIAFGLGVGLAFGLGGQDAAADYIKKLKTEIQTHEKVR